MSAKKYTGGRGAVSALAAPRFTLFWSLLLSWLLLSSAAAAPPPDDAIWRPAPEYVPLFTPAVPAGAFSAYVSRRPLDAELEALLADPATLRPPGAWQPQPTIALDAFGTTGTYNRWTLARLYGARRPRIARGPRHPAGGTAEFWTLISPYPDPVLRRLESGTLLIVVRIPSTEREP